MDGAIGLITKSYPFFEAVTKIRQDQLYPALCVIRN